MNTAQMIVFWLGGLGVAVLLAFRLGSGGQTVALVLVSGMLIYSLASHPDANMKSVVAVVGTIAACGAGAFYAHAVFRAREIHQPERQPHTAVENPEGYAIDPTSVKVSHLEYSSLVRDMSGRIENDSGKSVTEVVLHVSFHDGQELVDEADCRIPFGGYTELNGPLPPGETHSFTAVCPNFNLPQSSHLSLKHKVKSVRASTQ